MAATNRFTCIGDVRALGAMAAMELVTDRETREPAPEITKRLVHEAADRGLVLLSCGVYGNVIRFLPPLTVSNDILGEGLDIIEQALEAVLPA
jgi:4-aminobutyrate aminotransferase/(S)-3-amino-2-methylpropionate transaminase